MQVCSRKIRVMHALAVAIFITTYAGVAIGRIPGLALDRTGLALLGAIAMLATRILTTEAAVLAIDLPTILLLYSLMVLSSQFKLGGFYTWIAMRITRYMERPLMFLLILMAVSASLSAVFVNDIVCLAFTPVLTVSLLRAGLNGAVSGRPCRLKQHRFCSNYYGQSPKYAHRPARQTAFRSFPVVVRSANPHLPSRIICHNCTEA